MDIKASLDRVLTWPLERQQDAARMLDAMEQANHSHFDLSAEQLAGIDEALAAAKRGEFVPAEEMAAFWKKWGV
jgi:predicted transcriptional regulator